MMNYCAHPTCHTGDRCLPEGSEHIYCDMKNCFKYYCIAIVCPNNSFWVSYNGVVFAWLSVIAVMANRVNDSSNLFLWLLLLIVLTVAGSKDGSIYVNFNCF